MVDLVKVEEEGETAAVAARACEPETETGVAGSLRGAGRGGGPLLRRLVGGAAELEGLLQLKWLDNGSFWDE